MFQILSVCNGGGYRYCRTDPSHPKANAKGLYPLHRVLVENKLGRLLGKDEDVHHIDETKDNDDPGNLEALSSSEHTRLHHPALPLVTLTCQCGTSFSVKARTARLRQKRAKGPLCCSRNCGSRFGHTRRAA